MLATVLVVVTALLVWAGRVDADELSAHASYPLPGATDVSADAAVVATFTATPEHPDGIGLRVRDQSGADVLGSLVFREDLSSAVFRPLAPYSPGTYDVEVGLRGDGARIDESMAAWSFTVPEPTELWRGAGGPILLVLSASDVVDQLYSEILQAEGLTSYTAVLASELTPDHLDAHRVAIFADAQLAGSVDTAMVSAWVEAGGDLVLMQPRDTLAALAGIEHTGAHVSEATMRIDTSRAPGRGLPAEPMRVHGASDIVRPASDVQIVATVDDAAQAVPAPLVTVREVGANGGTVAAFTFDLAQSVMLTRQGNPAWAGQESDGVHPLRPNELFQAEDTYLEHGTVGIPIADEQMRLLSSILGHATVEDGPMPKSWYFPNGAKAVLVMAADDHGTGHGTQDSFDRMRELSPEGCDVAAWECIRATSWVYPWSGLSDAHAAEYVAQGFDIGVHATTRCNNWTAASLHHSLRNGLLDFWQAYPSVPYQTGSRLHCLAWSDYVSQPSIARTWGIRFDMNYSYWPPAWAQGQAGFLTGSGIPLRFMDPQRGLIDVYQQETHFFDETFSASIRPVREAIERALGPEQYFGAFGTHFDFHIPFDQELVDVALDLEVPMVSAQQMLDWVDARNASTMSVSGWSDGVLTFSNTVAPGAESLLHLMLPVVSEAGELTSVRGPKGDVSFVVDTIKGVDYAMFRGESGVYVASYGGR